MTITAQEKEIAKYPVGMDTSIRLIATGDITQKSIDKLIKMLELNKEDFPNDIVIDDDN